MHVTKKTKTKMSRRSKYVVVSDSEEEEENDGACFGTPPSSPIRIFSSLSLNQNTPLTTTTKKLPRSLARTGAKKAVRQVLHLKPRVMEMKDCLLTPASSFFISEWSFEFDDVGRTLSRENEPEENVYRMLKRVEDVYRFFKQSFTQVSGIYIGKSTNLRSRFNHHMKSKKKPEESLAMIGVGLFVEEDVHPSDRERWKMTCEVLGFQYERLLTDAVIKSTLPMFEDTQEPGGGGRCGGENTTECIVYMLLTFSN
jgi:hypothetical protein